MLNQLWHILYSYLGGWLQRLLLVVCVVVWIVIAVLSPGRQDSQVAAAPRAAEELDSHYSLLGSRDELKPLDRDMLANLPEKASKIILGGPQYNNDDLTHLSRLKYLTELDLVKTSITDEGLKLLTEHKHLVTLKLNGHPIGDRGIEYLKQAKNLIILELSRTNVTDAAIPAFSEMSNLKNLHLEHTFVTPAGLRQLLADGHPARIMYSAANMSYDEFESLKNTDSAHRIIFRGGSNPSHSTSGNLFFRVFYSLFPLMFCGAVIGSRLKQQFGAARSQLLPRFRFPHLFVGIGLLSIVALINISLGYANGGTGWAVAGVTLLALLFAAWVSSFPHSHVAQLPTVVFVSALLFGEVVLQFLGDYWEGKYQPLAVSLTGGALFGFCFYLWRIATMTEEDEAYSMPSWAELTQLTWNKNSRPEFQRMVGRSVSRSKIWTRTIDLVFRVANLRYHGGNTWSHAMLYNVMSWQRLMFMPLLFPLMAATQMPFYRGLSDGTLKTFQLGLICIAPAFVVICIEAGQFLQRAAYYKYEFLRPASRREFANNIAWSTLFNNAVGIGINGVWALILIGWVDPQRSTLFFAISFLTLVLLMIPLTAGLVLWGGTFRKIWQFVLGIFALEAVFGAVGAFFVYAQSNNSLSLLLLGYTLMGGLGAVLIVTAHRKWQQLEWT